MRIIESFRNMFRIPELRNRLWFTFGILVLFRLGGHIVVPGVNGDAVEKFSGEAEKSMGTAWHFLQVISGGALGNLGVFALGIMPYITSSIIMQLMTKVSPTLEALAKEGPSGQRRISQYTRYLTVPICIVQAWLAVRAIQQMMPGEIFYSTGFFASAKVVTGLTAGALFTMWLGEQITEFGLGNGASVLIMANIIAKMPETVGMLIRGAHAQTVAGDSLVIMAVLYIASIGATVFVTQAQRRIPIQHAKHFRGRRVWMGSRSHMPLRVNTAGVMPVIFAGSILIVPALLAMVPGMGFMKDLLGRGYFFYTVAYVAMIFFFSYFWTYLFFRPDEMANNLKEYGSFIPGIRPGENTADYLNQILAKITLAGAAFLCLISLLPDLASAWLRVDRWVANFLGGTGILIVVGVSLDIVQKIESHLLMHEYEGFVGSSGIRGRR